ncbi:MAG: CPBP family intramembrane metalloprotease [Anaerolineae bacterium]|nr:CPBP family intramembrane metalloprotease [Anaerolineae bacterium]
MPSLGGIVSAVLLTIALIIFVAAASMVWMTMVSDETREDQTQASEALADSVNTLGLAFLLAATAAVGEEIAFRGALQPVFGFWPTAIIFALTHAQYTLTPAWLIIFGVAVGFGWIRQRYNTTVAILTHFLYNFALLSIALSVPEETGETILRLFS